MLAVPFQKTTALHRTDGAGNEVLGQDEQLLPCDPHWAETQVEVTENIEKPEVYKDRTRYPQEVVSSLSSGCLSPDCSNPWWDGYRQNVSTYGETGWDDLKPLSQRLGLVIVMTERLQMVSVQQLLWVGTAYFNRPGPQSKLLFLPSPFHQAVVL